MSAMAEETVGHSTGELMVNAAESETEGNTNIGGAPAQMQSCEYVGRGDRTC